MPSTNEILKKFKKLKTLPHVGIKLSQLISDEDVSVQQLEEVIRLDPTLVLRLLRLVNSPYYGLREKVDSVSKAVVFIGMKHLRNMVVLNALKDIFKQSSEEGSFSRNKLWLHCAVISICSQMISERIFKKKGEDPFLCGILHDIGIIVEAQVEEELFNELIAAFKPGKKSFVEFEREIIGSDHSAIGSKLAKDWKLPPNVQEGIKNHHKVGGAITPESISGIVQMSEYFAAKIDYTMVPGVVPVLSQSLMNHIKDNLNEYKSLMKELPGEVAKAMEIYQLDDEEEAS